MGDSATYCKGRGAYIQREILLFEYTLSNGQ